MASAQVNLTNAEHEVLREMRQRSGKTEDELVHEVVAQRIIEQ